MFRHLVNKKSAQAGFTLVELMVVVAIIGVLAAIGIPQVNRYIAKARQSEARTNLSAIFALNKNFQLEFSGYTNCLSCMGYRPEGTLRYNTGWSQAVAPGTIPPAWTASGRTVPADDPDANSAGNAPNTLAACPENGSIATCRTLRGANNNPPPAIAGSAIAANFTTFTAESVALLVSGANNDIWRIDQNKNLTNPQDGTL